MTAPFEHPNRARQRENFEISLERAMFDKPIPTEMLFTPGIEKALKQVSKTKSSEDIRAAREAFENRDEETAALYAQQQAQIKKLLSS